MVGCTIQDSRDPQSHNIFIVLLWAVAGISLRPFRHISPIIPYLDNFWSSPRLVLISLNHIFGRSINSSSGSCLWTNWDHGWVDKTTPYNIPMWCRHFIQQTICSHSLNHLTKTLIDSPNPNWCWSVINDWISTEGDQTRVIASQPSSASAPWLQWTSMRLTEAELIIRSWWRHPVDSKSLNNNK